MNRKARVQSPRNVIVVSDTHCGCGLALSPVDGFHLDTGGLYMPSKLQLKLWAWWREFWDEWVPMVTKGEPFDLVHNGDCIDGVHHNSTTQVTHNLERQRDMAIEIMEPVVKRCIDSGGRYFHVRGTEAHVGKSGEHEEAIAKALGAVKDDVGNYARYELWLHVGGKDGGLVHLLHHIGSTGSSHHEASAVNGEIATEFVEAARWDEKPPQIVVRSHRHRCIEVRLPVKNGFATSVVTPAWQLKTPFAFKIPGARLAPPQIGGILIRQGDRALFTDLFVKHIERSTPE